MSKVVRRCCDLIFSIPAFTRVSSQPNQIRVDSRLIISDLRLSAKICGKNFYPAKNLFIRSQYFCTIISVLTCPPRAKEFSFTPVRSANFLTDL